MKLFFAEAGHDYGSYSFPYQVLLLKEAKDEEGEIYGRGFLPFRHKKNLFYLSRSSRVALDKFTLSSENKRIIKKTGEFTGERISLSEFSYSFSVQKECKTWARERGWKISSSSLKFIFGGSFFNYVWVWRGKEGNPVGYHVVFEGRDFVHAAHLFYHSLSSKDLPSRMLLAVVSSAQKEGKKLAYLGTAYGQRGSHKKGFSGFEFFNGFSWSADPSEWKYVDQRGSNDYLLRDKEYLDRFFSGKKEELFKTKGISV